MKTLKKTLCLVLALVMAFSLMSVASASNLDSYTDADKVGTAYEEAVEVLLGLGIVNGVSATEIAPDGYYTRAQAAKIATYLAVGPEVAEMLPAAESFTDVPASHWASKYIAYCAGKNILNGVSATEYAPEEKVTGYQFAKMVLAAAGYGANDEFVGGNWAIATAQWALSADNDLFAGDASAATNDPITRQQAMLIAFNALKNVEGVAFNKITETYGASGVDFNDNYKLNSVVDTIDQNQATGAENTIGTSTNVYKFATGLELVGHKVTVYFVDAATTGFTAGEKVVAIIDETTELAVAGNETAAVLKANLAAAGVVADTAANYNVVQNGDISASGTAITLGTTKGSDLGACTLLIYDKAVIGAVKADEYKVSKVVAYTAPTASADGSIEIAGVTTAYTVGTADVVTLKDLKDTETVDEVALYDGIKVGDYVALQANGTAPLSVTKLDTVVGAISEFVDATTDSIVVGGKTYAISAVADLASITNVTAGMVGTTEYTFILDKAGAVVGYTTYTAASTADSYAKILDCAYAAGEAASISNGYTAKYATFTAYVLLADGSKTTLTYTSKTETAIADLKTEMDAGTLAIGDVVKFAAKDGVITEISAALTEAVGTVDAYAITAKTASVGGAYLTATTPVIYMDSTPVSNTAKVITGYAATEAATAANAFFVVENDAIVCVFVEGAYVGTPETAKTVAYLPAALAISGTKYDATLEANIFGYTVYVDGVATTLWSEANDLSATAGFVEYTITDGYLTAVSNTVTGLSAASGTVNFIDESVVVVGTTQLTYADVEVITNSTANGVSATGALAKDAVIVGLKDADGALVYAAIITD